MTEERKDGSEELTGDSLAVVVRHGYKHYGSRKNTNQVLNNFNMAVTKGTIYGLLGASGCGKTTLLSCIVGRRRLDSGRLWVLGGRPGTKDSGIPGRRVGYMPQEIALYGEFSIKETIMYFGWIFGMKTAEIKEQMDFLFEFLELPDQKRLVKNLSGGQQRRLSVAAALVHNPELFILDEPTVGVDPVLRQKIWKHLVQICSDGRKTVIITTHYIEEARQAHKIGLMRGGCLLAEEAPQKLLTLYKCESLEEVFLKLCRQQGGETENPMTPAEASSFDEHIFEKLPSIRTSKAKWFFVLTSRGKSRALLHKNFLRLWRNVGVMLFNFAIPVLQVILFCLAVGHDPEKLPIAIVNKEVNVINGYCPFESGCTGTNLSCVFAHELPEHEFEKVWFENLEDAKNAVRREDVWGVIYFNKNFSIALAARMNKGQEASGKTLSDSEIKIWLDMSDQQIGLMMQRNLQNNFRRFTKKILKQCDKDPRFADLPVNFQKPIYGAHERSYTDFVAPGVILTVVFFLAVALTALTLISERLEGLLDRSWVAGVTPTEVLFSHIVTQLVVSVVQSVLVIVCTFMVFKVQCEGNMFLVISLTIMQGFCGMCFGFVISATCDKERTAVQVALGSFHPLLMLSGVIWPVEGMHYILRYISYCLPLTLATTSLRTIMSRGWSMEWQDVWLGFATTFGWILVFLVASLVLMKMKKH